MGLRHRIQKIMRGEVLEPSPPQSKRRVAEKTGDYTCVDGDSGTIFYTTGADVDFTLPAVTITGWHAWFYCMVDDELRVSSAENDNIIGFNDIDLDSVEYTDDGDQIGGSVYSVSTGTKWLCMPMHWDTAGLAQTIGLAD